MCSNDNKVNLIYADCLHLDAHLHIVNSRAYTEWLGYTVYQVIYA